MACQVGGAQFLRPALALWSCFVPGFSVSLALPAGLCWWQGALCAPAGPGLLAPRPGPSLRTQGASCFGGTVLVMPVLLVRHSLQCGCPPFFSFLPAWRSEAGTECPDVPLPAPKAADALHGKVRPFVVVMGSKPFQRVGFLCPLPGFPFDPPVNWARKLGGRPEAPSCKAGKSWHPCPLLSPLSWGSRLLVSQGLLNRLAVR